MYEQAEPVRSPFSGPDSRQTSGLPPQPRPVPQSGSRGRVRHGNGASDHDKQREDQDTSSHTYEDAEEVKRYATSADRAYPGGASGRRGVCSFLRARRSCLAAGIAVLLSLGAMGLAPLTFSNKQEISQLSTTFAALKRDQDDLRQLSITVDALKRDQDGVSTSVHTLKRDQDDMSTSVHTLKRDQDDMSTTVDALKRDQDDMSTTVDALKRDQDDMSTSVHTLKRDQDDMSTSVHTLKRDQDDMSTTVDALKRDQDDMSTTVDALKRDQDDMSTTVDALKRDQDDMSTTVDALKRDQDDMSTTVDALKRDLNNERNRTAILEQRLHKIETTLPSCPEGYTIWRGICYKAFNIRKTFDQATAACGADGGTLAMPRDADTNAFLVSLYKSVRGVYWIGLHDQREEGKFEWMDGSALGPYNSWALGRPFKSVDISDCVLYCPQESQKDKWCDFRCKWSNYFICQAAPGEIPR
ncbi:Fibrinogen C domain-containing protein 1 [Branchiostoma belcheri]|nr:Fibrinogen C domain-containing protein 1 [Branchiostoma belcheri]